MIIKFAACNCKYLHISRVFFYDNNTHIDFVIYSLIQIINDYFNIKCTIAENYININNMELFFECYEVIEYLDMDGVIKYIIKLFGLKYYILII